MARSWYSVMICIICPSRIASHSNMIYHQPLHLLVEISIPIKNQITPRSNEMWQYLQRHCNAGEPEHADELAEHPFFSFSINQSSSMQWE